MNAQKNNQPRPAIEGRLPANPEKLATTPGQLLTPPSQRPKLFDRLPGESAEAYAAFQCYLALGPPRSVNCAARQLGLRPGHLGYWAIRFQWRTRAAACDQYTSLSRAKFL